MRPQIVLHLRRRRPQYGPQCQVKFKMRYSLQTWPILWPTSHTVADVSLKQDPTSMPTNFRPQIWFQVIISVIGS